MKKHLHGAAILLVSILALTVGCQEYPQVEAGYISGGRNIEAYRYDHSEGYPPFPDKAKFIGTLSGDWFEMGRQFGERSGEMTLYVSDIWWKDTCRMWGREESLKAFELYEAQIEALDRGLVEFMQGLVEGAARWLDRSPYADPSHPMHGSNYQRVLSVNLWDEWSMMHPRQFPDGASTFGGDRKAPDRTGVAGCSAFAARGAATMDGEVISAHNRHSPFDPRAYEEVYILDSKEGHRCWVLTNSPQVAANQVVNEKGVSLSLLAGGFTNPRSLDYQDHSYYAEGFGVPWFHLFLYVAVHADTAEEAIEMLTLGTPQYRSKTGRKSLLRGGGWNFLVADSDTLAVVESTADRYAVRYAGESFPFTGSEWENPSYIVATNHFICDFSYDKNNVRTDIPMTIFMEGYERDPGTGAIKELNDSGQRFWTLMWDMKKNFGRIDSYRTQQILSGLYVYEKETGKKVQAVIDRDGVPRIYGTQKPCTQGLLAFWGATCDAKIAVLKDEEINLHWTLGNPSHWQGAWDAYSFENQN